MSIRVSIERYHYLSDSEKESVPDNGSGKEYANYLRIIHGKDTVLLESDAMEPEDATFTRDLYWIEKAINTAYELGVNDSNKQRLMLLKATFNLLSLYKECAWIANPLGEVIEYGGQNKTGYDLIEDIASEIGEKHGRLD